MRGFDERNWHPTPRRAQEDTEANILRRAASILRKHDASNTADDLDAMADELDAALAKDQS